MKFCFEISDLFCSNSNFVLSNFSIRNELDKSGPTKPNALKTKQPISFLKKNTQLKQKWALPPPSYLVASVNIFNFFVFLVDLQICNSVCVCIFRNNLFFLLLKKYSHFERKKTIVKQICERKSCASAKRNTYYKIINIFKEMKKRKKQILFYSQKDVFL